MPRNRLFETERAEGPLPLGPGETWSLVKDLRWRITVNNFKIGWRERKWAYIMMAFTLCFMIGMLVLIATEDTSHTSYGPGVEQNPYFEEQFEVPIPAFVLVPLCEGGRLLRVKIVCHPRCYILRLFLLFITQSHTAPTCFTIERIRPPVFCSLKAESADRAGY